MDSINKHPKTVIAVIVVVLIGVGIWAKSQLPSNKPNFTEETAFFTVDNGTTHFQDVASNIPPFDHNGQQAVRAYVFQCNGKEFVGYLERFTADGQRMLQKIHDQAQTGPPDGRMIREANTTGKEIKRPSDAKWTSAADPKANTITDVKCPDGSGTPTPVSP